MKSRTALITGASSGIGETFARMFAADGMDLVLVARSEDKLRGLAKELGGERRVEVVPMDLGAGGAAEKLKAAVDKLGLAVDVLVNNAGFGTAGAFHKQDPARERQEVLLNCAAIVDLTHAFLPDMLKRGHGGVINVASVAAFQPLPYMSVYAATKAFVLSFTEGLRGEVSRKGIKVTALCPGPVDTPFFEATGAKDLRKTVPPITMMTVDQVVAQAIRGWKAGKGVVVPGLINKGLSLSSKLMPRRLMTAMTAAVMKKS